MSPAPAFERFTGLGTTIVVGSADPAALGPAVLAVRAEVEACDRACSRFRADSDLSRLSEAGWSGPASEWLCDAVATALEAARATGGLVDPTIGQCLIDLGYDRSFEHLDPAGPLTVTAAHVPAWQRVTVSRGGRRVTVPAGVRLDLGATAKALCADRAAAAAARSAGPGVLVSMGGDIAVAGSAPAGGWVVRVTDRSDSAPRRTDQPGRQHRLHGRRHPRRGRSRLAAPEGLRRPPGAHRRVGGPHRRLARTLAYLSWPTAMIHAVGSGAGAGADTGRAWSTAIYGACAMAFGGAVAARAAMGRRSRAAEPAVTLRARPVSRAPA